MAAYDVCPDGEDVAFLAYCAVAQDFRLLVEGLVLPRYMSEMGSLISEWILARRIHDPKNWPPSYKALQEMFPEVEWPDVDDIRGLDPEVPAYDVMMSYQRFLAAAINASTFEIVRLDLYSEERQTMLGALNYRIEELRRLTEYVKGSFTVGDDVEELSRAFFGDYREGAKDFSSLSSPMRWMRECCEPMEEGIYSIFARPKDGKSFLTMLNANHWAYEQGYNVVLADPENSSKLIKQRLLAERMEVHWQSVRKFEMHVKRGLEITEDMTEAIERYPTAESFLRENQRLHVLGKDKIDPKYLGFTVAQILDLAHSTGSDIIAAEQVHKYVDPSSVNSKMSEAMKAHRAITTMSNTPGHLWWVSTQMNREFSPKKGKIPVPSDQGVFGSDALAQNAVFMANVWKIDMVDDVVPDKCSWIWMISPILNRNSSGEDNYFIRFRPFDIYEELDAITGRAMCEARLAAIKQEHEAAEKRGKKMHKDNAVGTRSSQLLKEKTEGNPATPASRWKGATRTRYDTEE